MSCIQIRNKKWKAEIDLHGGRIISLRCENRNLLGTYHRIDGKIGNTHVCIPNFGKEGVEQYGLPFHGPARNKEWGHLQDVISKNKCESLKIECRLRKTETYKAELLASQTFSFQNNSFIHEITVKNLSEEAVPVNIGIHNYWDASCGWNGAKVNNVDITSSVKANRMIVLQEKNKIDLPGQRSIYWEVKGFSHAVTWAGFQDSKYDCTYVCIEPIRAADIFSANRKSLLSPLQTIQVAQMIHCL